MAGTTDGPMLLKLAPLPRNQVGPFLILGVDKDASKDAIEAAWAQRLIWARKGQTPVPLEDINWAREVLCDPERRARADVVSVNVDTAEATLRTLRERFLQASAVGQPIEVTPELEGYEPDLPVTTVEEVLGQLRLPELPREVPAVAVLLREMHETPLDPWAFSLEAPASQER